MSRISKEFRSPEGKLIAFFERSRDSWKTKCMDAKYKIKKLHQQVQYANERKEEFKSRVKELEEELSQLRAREQRKDEDLEGKKKLIAR